MLNRALYVLCFLSFATSVAGATFLALDLLPNQPLASAKLQHRLSVRFVP